MKIVKRLPSEHVEQRNFVSWFRKNYGETRIFAIPNGGGRTKSNAVALKAEGVTAGVPDLYVPEWGLWIEMKKQKGGRLSKEQADWRKYLLSIGDYHMVCKGCDDAIEKVKELRELMGTG